MNNNILHMKNSSFKCTIMRVITNTCDQIWKDATMVAGLIEMHYG